DRRGVVAPAVEGEDALRGRIEDDGVGVLVRLDGADCLEAFQLKDGDVVGLPIANEAAAQLRGHSNSVNALETGDGSLQVITVGVQDSDFGAVGNVHAPRGAIHGDIIPAAVAGYSDGLEQVVSWSSGEDGSAGERDQRQRGQGHHGRISVEKLDSRDYD